MARVHPSLFEEHVMDQLREQVARARRRLVLEQFLGRLVWCLLGAFTSRPSLSPCRAFLPSRTCRRIGT